jgi:hypothetical protein
MMKAIFIQDWAENVLGSDLREEWQKEKAFE